VTQSEEKIKQSIIDCLKDIEWGIMQGKIDTVITKLEEAQKLTQEWGVKNITVCPLGLQIEHKPILNV